MASPFSMLSRLSKARRASQKQVPGTDDVPPKDITRADSKSSLRSFATKTRKGLKGMGGKEGKSDSAVATPSATPPMTPSLTPAALPAATIPDLKSTTVASLATSATAVTEEAYIVPQRALDAHSSEGESVHDVMAKETSSSVTVDRSTPAGEEAMVVPHEVVVGSNEAAVGGRPNGVHHEESSFESIELVDAPPSVPSAEEVTSKANEDARPAYHPTSEAALPKVGSGVGVDVAAFEEEKEKLSAEVQRLQTEISTQIVQSDQRIAAVEEEKALLGQELERLRAEHSKALQDQQSSSSEIDHLRSELSTQKSQVGQRITSIEQEKASLSQELEHLRSGRVVALEKEREDLMSQLQRLEQETTEKLSQREERVMAVELQKGQLSQELKRLEEALTDLRKEKKLVEESLSDVEHEKTSIAEDTRRLQAELKKVMQEKEVRNQQAISLDREREVLTIKVQALSDEARSAHDKVDTQKVLVQALEREMADVRREHMRLTHETTQAREESRRAREEGKKAENRNREEFARQLQAVHDKYDPLERQNRMLQDQIRQQSEEFVSVYDSPSKIFSRKFNTPAGDGVLATMTTLNITIFQVAASLADDLYLENNDQVQPVSLDVDEEAALISRMTDILGREVILVLRSTDQVAGQDPLPMQIALQASINYCCKQIMTSWYPGHWDYGDFLGALHARIQGSEDPETAVKWRCVTRRQCSSPSQDTQSHLSEFICSHLADVLAVAGWSSPSLLSANAERVSNIVRLALRLNKLIGEDTGPGHIEPLLVSPEIRYDQDVMDNAYAEDDHDLDTSLDGWASERVICTTDLGLHRIVKVDHRENDESADGAAYGHVVLKPKVVLRSVLEQL